MAKMSKFIFYLLICVLFNEAVITFIIPKFGYKNVRKHVTEF